MAYCNKQFLGSAAKGHLSKHHTKEHSGGTQYSIRYECRDCDQSWNESPSDKGNLAMKAAQRHHDKEHMIGEVPEHKCVHCRRAPFSSEAALNAHTRTVH